MGDDNRTIAGDRDKRRPPTFTFVRCREPRYRTRRAFGSDGGRQSIFACVVCGEPDAGNVGIFDLPRDDELIRALGLGWPPLANLCADHYDLGAAVLAGLAYGLELLGVPVRVPDEARVVSAESLADARAIAAIAAATFRTFYGPKAA